MSSSVSSNSEEVLSDNKENNINKQEEAQNVNLNDSANDSEENIVGTRQAVDRSNDESSSYEVLKKLEILKEIKNKTDDLQKLKSKLIEEFDCIETETKCLQNFQTELDLLIQEKMEHLEIFRQIQDDILNMETTIRQTEDEKKRAINTVMSLHLEYKPLKSQINQLRESIGLSKTEEKEELQLVEEFIKKLQPFAEQKQQLNKPEQTTKPQTAKLQKSPESKLEFTSSNCSSPATSIGMPMFAQMPKLNSAFLPSQFVLNMAQQLRSQSPQAPQPPPQAPFILGQNKPLLEPSQNNPQQQQQLQSIPASFRQQPPPMKSCLSCNQQIHRNAPICPLCKAKSRSRNPKKPKKKSDAQSSSMSPPPPMDNGLSSRSISKPKQLLENKQR